MKLSNIQEIFKGLEEEEIKGYHPFSHKNRREIYRELTRAPCLNSSQLSSRTGIKASNTVWHLRKLQREGYVHSVKYQSEIFYPEWLVLPEDLKLFYWINKKGVASIIRSLLFGCKGVDELISNMSRATFYRYLQVLKELGVIETGRGRKSWVCLKDVFFQKMEEYDRRGMKFKRDLIKRLERGGYEVETVGTYNYEVKLRIVGREKFTMSIYISPIRTALGVFE